MKNQDLVGMVLGPNAPGGWGYPGMIAFGQDGTDPSAPVPAAPPPGHPAHHYANPYMYGGCYGPAPTLDPHFVAAMTAQRHAVLVGPNCGPQEVEQMLGFENIPASIPVGATVTVNATPENIAKLTRLFIPSSVASSVVVIDVKIGQKSQLLGSGAIPGLVFSEVSTNNRINGDTCYIRQPVKLTFQNVGLSDIGGLFYAAVGLIGVQGGNPQILGGPFGGT